MLVKDYYEILQIPTHATTDEIKHAFRRLAMIYHPDKNKNDSGSIVHFNEIKEAYEVLTNPAKKESWLQDRWYDKSLGRKRKTITVTPVNIFKLSLELEKYVSRLDVHRMNKEGLVEYISELLSDDVIVKLSMFKDIELNRGIISNILMAIKSLPPSYIEGILSILKKFAGSDEAALQQIDSFAVEHKSAFRWQKYKIILVVILTVIICLLIYLFSA